MFLIKDPHKINREDTTHDTDKRANIGFSVSLYARLPV